MGRLEAAPGTRGVRHQTLLTPLARFTSAHSQSWDNGSPVQRCFSARKFKLKNSKRPRSRTSRICIEAPFIWCVIDQMRRILCRMYICRPGKPSIVSSLERTAGLGFLRSYSMRSGITGGGG